MSVPSIQEHLRLTPSDRIADQIRGIITRENRNHPRSLQKALGPSEIGHPCSRKLVLHIIDAPECNPGFDPLPSEIGIAYHARMERHMLAENMRLGRERYLTENRVTVWPAGVEGCEPALAGSADCYDIDEQRVLDWKILGNTSMDELRLRGPKTSYRRQIQLYGKGFELLGYPVKSVALVAIPKSGTTYGIKVYEYPYDPTVSDQVQSRWHQLLVLADVLGVEKNPQMIAAVEATEETCEFCPFFSRSPDGSGYQCAGPGKPMGPPL